MEPIKAKHLYPIQRKSGVSLVEILVAGFILAFVIVLIIKGMTYNSSIIDRNLQITLALSQAETVMERLRNHEYKSITNDFGANGMYGPVFSLNGIDGIGAVNLNNINDDLIQVDIIISWRDDITGRILGEDKNLNGRLDGGEDTNNNGILNSPVSLSSLIANKGM